ncbi:MAG: hypothetical protein AABX74_00375 [Nanoarchaeota archaeon]
MRNKKSQLEDLLPLLLLTVILFFLFIFAFHTEQARAKKTAAEVNFYSLSKDSTQLLINFLKSPFALDNYKNGNMADAISNYFLTKDKILLGQINIQAKEFFSMSDLETDSSFWSLEIKYPGEKTLKIESDKSKEYMAKRTISTITIPTSNLDKLIEIKLFIFYTKFTVK